MIDLSKSIVVERLGSGAITPFDRDRLYISVYESCRHRKTAITDASALTTTILAKLLQQLLRQARGAVLPDVLIRNTVYEALNRFDVSAASYYAAYHPSKKP